MKINLENNNIDLDEEYINIGKKYEAKFRNKLKDHDCYYIKIPDYTSTGNMTRSPSDFLVVKNGNSYLFEVKHTNNINNFDISLFRDKQLIELHKHRILGKGNSYVVFFNPDGIFIVDFYQINNYIQQYHKKSIPFLFIKKHSRNMCDILE